MVLLCLNEVGYEDFYSILAFSGFYISPDGYCIAVNHSLCLNNVQIKRVFGKD